jgi:Uncharacterised conserved protein (DUF2368)
MGAYMSKSSSANDERSKKFATRIRDSVEDEIARRIMVQREVQMAVNIAKARDTIWIFGSAWASLVTGTVAAKALGRQVPPLVGVPLVVGALVLGNMADMAYGNKLNRVTKEAEHILQYERGRMVPIKQAPFFKFYTDEEKMSWHDPATAVGDLWPNRMIARDPNP